MELHPLNITLYNTWDFTVFSEENFRVGKRVLSFFCCENDLNITKCFFGNTCKILSDVSSVLNKKTLFKLIFLTHFNCFQMLFIVFFGGV